MLKISDILNIIKEIIEDRDKSELLLKKASKEQLRILIALAITRQDTIAIYSQGDLEFVTLLHEVCNG